MSSLKDLLQSCNLCDCMRDSLMRDIIVLGICDNSTRKMLLQRRNISLKDAVDIRRGSEVTKQQMTSISTNASVYATRQHYVKEKKKREKGTGQHDATIPVPILWKETLTQERTLSSVAEEMFQMSETESLRCVLPTRHKKESEQRGSGRTQ